MGITLIVVSQSVVTDGASCIPLLDWGCREAVPGNSPDAMSVPETDTGGLVEHTKALERMTLKELGKLPP